MTKRCPEGKVRKGNKCFKKSYNITIHKDHIHSTDGDYDVENAVIRNATGELGRTTEETEDIYCIIEASVDKALRKGSLGGYINTHGHEWSWELD